jgi:hypothetical protein
MQNLIALKIQQNQNVIANLFKAPDKTCAAWTYCKTFLEC